jgi:hypothetical protein
LILLKGSQPEGQGGIDIALLYAAATAKASTTAAATVKASTTAAATAKASTTAATTSKNAAPVVKERVFANASYEFVGYTSLAHKLCQSIYYYDVYKSLKNGKVLHAVQCGDAVYAKRLSAFNGRFICAGAFYLHVPKKAKMYHIVFDRDYGSIHMVARSHVVKPLPAESNSDDKTLATIVGSLRKIAHHASIHGSIPNLPDGDG